MTPLLTHLPGSRLKYQLPQNVLNKLYCSYLRHILESASEVCGDCNRTDTVRHEQVQIIAFLQSLYLVERRRIQKLALMYKINRL